MGAGVRGGIPKVLVVEDDLDLQTTTRLVLESQGFEVEVSGNGLDGLSRLRAGSFDVALVDIMLPGIDGLKLTKQARAEGSCPIVLLTARDLPSDMVGGLDAGADDYITKPFDGDVLAARLRAVMRRSPGPATPEPEPLFRFGALSIDFPGMTVRRGDEDIRLSATEFKLLEALVTNAGIVLSRERLLDLVWDGTHWGDDRVVDVTIQRLRSKVGAEIVETVRGAGYKAPKNPEL